MSYSYAFAPLLTLLSLIYRRSLPLLQRLLYMLGGLIGLSFVVHGYLGTAFIGRGYDLALVRIGVIPERAAFLHVELDVYCGGIALLVRDILQTDGLMYIVAGLPCLSGTFSRRTVLPEI